MASVKILNNKYISIAMTLIFLMTWFSGCGELDELSKPDYITVTVQCNADLRLADSPETYINNALIRIEIIKSGGEKVSDLVTTSLSLTRSVVGTFQLYREQSITCIGTVIMESVEEYSNYTFDSDTETILWSDVYPTWDFGDSTTVYRTLSIRGVKT